MRMSLDLPHENPTTAMSISELSRAIPYYTEPYSNRNKFIETSIVLIKFSMFVIICFQT